MLDLSYSGGGKRSKNADNRGAWLDETCPEPADGIVWTYEYTGIECETWVPVVKQMDGDASGASRINQWSEIQNHSMETICI